MLYLRSFGIFFLLVAHLRVSQLRVLGLGRFGMENGEALARDPEIPAFFALPAHSLSPSVPPSGSVSVYERISPCVLLTAWHRTSPKVERLRQARVPKETPHPVYPVAIFRPFGFISQASSRQGTDPPPIVPLRSNPSGFLSQAPSLRAEEGGANPPPTRLPIVPLRGDLLQSFFRPGLVLRSQIASA